MIKIKPTDYLDCNPGRIAQHPAYANLLPIVEALQARGNRPCDGGFANSQNGWICVFSQPIDFEFLRREFSFPDSIDVSEEHDTIFDSLSWCTIWGPSHIFSRCQ
jgi:hypothetical protein